MTETPLPVDRIPAFSFDGEQLVELTEQEYREHFARQAAQYGKPWRRDPSDPGGTPGYRPDWAKPER